MTADGIKEIISRAEGTEVEFKAAHFELPKSSFETICAFLNRQGGHLLLGVGNDGTIEGVLEESAPKLLNDLVTAANSPQKLSPPFYLSPQIIAIEDKTIIYCYVPASSQVHRTAGRIYDRNATDGDIDITDSTHQVTQLYLRKQQTYTENRLYPFATIADFRPDLIQRVRTMAGNQRPGHPWMALSDEDLLQSAGLRLKDMATGQEGYTLAALLLLGRDAAILSALPHHKTDALLRVQDRERYDDRDDIRTNLIESYDRLMAFAAKHLPDPFYLEGMQRVSLRDKIFREVVANLVVHREFANAYPAKFIIERDGVRTENWNRPHGHGLLLPDRTVPFPKNPVIARFFREIGLVEELGSGLRNAFQYVPHYSGGKEPVFEEGDVFTVLIPMGSSTHDGNYLSDQTIAYTGKKLYTIISEGVSEGINEGVSEGVKQYLIQLVILLHEQPGSSLSLLALAVGKGRSTVERYLGLLKSAGLVTFNGAPKTGGYFLTEALAERLADKGH